MIASQATSRTKKSDAAVIVTNITNRGHAQEARHAIVTTLKQ